MSGGNTEYLPDRTLVIVDMQDHFLSSANQNMVERMCDLITHARINEWGIILVEFCNCGDTIKAILDTVSGYEHLETVRKDQNDGGPEVVACLRAHPKWSLNILVCGVFGDACVSATVAGIFENSDTVEVDVVTDLIYPNYRSDGKYNDGQHEREIEMVSLGLQESFVA